MGKIRTSYLVLGFLILATLFVTIGLPNGKFRWTAVAQYFGGDLPPNVKDRYISNAGIQVFLTNQDIIEVWGACHPSGSQTVCDLLARIDPTRLKPTTKTPGEAFNAVDRSTGWRVILYYLGKDSGGIDLYQLNVYNNGGGLVDDRMLITLLGKNVGLRGR
ncbi:MAG: hypothetical protein KJ064_16205 [Anaerolineae bacterium]|nr:hypothetical protein [Anaerolineae bacterium]